MKKLLLAISLIALSSSAVIASSFEAGAVFLLIYPGAKATSMGGAFSAVADDATATYYSVGSLGFKRNIEFTLIHSPWLRGLAPDMYYEFTGVVYPLPVGTLGADITYSTYGLFTGNDESGNYLGTWRPYDIALSLAYGFPLDSTISVGVNMKFIHSFLAPSDILRKATGIPGGGQGTTFAAGMGAFYRPLYYTELPNYIQFLRRSTVSAMFDNIGPGIRYTATGEKDPLPELLRMGIALRPVFNKIHKVTISADVNKVLVGISRDYRELGMKYVIDEAWKHIGVDYTFFDMISLRAGYFYDKEGERMGITYGAGFHIKNFKLDVSDDHKIYSFDNGGANMRYSLSYVLHR